MIDTVEQAYWTCDCHPGAEGPLIRDTADMVWTLLRERNGLATDTSIRPEADMSTAKRVANAWSCADNGDLWGLLANLMEAHPEWSDIQCKDILRAWVKVRASSPWQDNLLVFWQQWKQHHRELKKGLAQARNLTWAQKCRYCEIWSANHPIMSPFCGVAELLLGLSEEMTAPPRTLQADSRYQDGIECSVESKHLKAGKEALKKEVIIVTTPATIEDFSAFGASRQLIWALQNCGFPWSLRQPWDDSIELDPRTVQGVVFWSYRHRHQDFAYHAMAFERACHALQIPVVNSILSGWDTRHSTILRNLGQAGVRCPRFQKFTNVDDIELKYPLILRVDGLHRGQQMHLVQDAGEAQALVSSKRTEFLASGSEPRALPPPNLALEFIDVADEHGRYHKRRAYVVGSTVLLRHHIINNNWLVNFNSSESSGESARANREFVRGGEEDLELILHAGQASGSEITALDYSRTQDGVYVFWEANRQFRMNGDKGYTLSEATSENVTKRRTARDQNLGEALLKLLEERFGHPVDYSYSNMRV